MEELKKQVMCKRTLGQRSKEEGSKCDENCEPYWLIGIQ